MQVFSSDSATKARQLFGQLAEVMHSKAAKAIECLEYGLEDALALMALPAKYRRRMKSTNIQKRLIQEVRRRERVIRIFTNEDSALRLIGALLAEIHDEWPERRYLDMTEFNEWQEERKTKSQKTVAVINRKNDQSNGVEFTADFGLDRESPEYINSNISLYCSLI